MSNDAGHHDHAPSAPPLEYRSIEADRVKLKRWAFCRAIFYAVFFAMLSAVAAYLELGDVMQVIRQHDWMGGEVGIVLLAFPIGMFVWSVRSAIQIVQGGVDYPFQQKRR